MSGTRIIQTALHGLEKHNKKYALAAMCVGVGMGYAVIIEKI
jgi:acetyl-CoA acetyltransferase